MDVTLGLGSLVGGIFSGIGQSNAAEKQLQAQRETNEQNYKIWQEQKEHNVDMFNMENEANIANWWTQFNATNEYNSAAAQRQRLEEAGLNPYLMMNGGNAGYASSSGISSAHVNPSQSPTMQNAHPSAFVDPISHAVEKIVNSFEGLNIGLNQGASAKATEETTPAVVNNIEADTENKKADTTKKEAETKGEEARTIKTETETEGLKIDNTYKDSMYAVEWDIKDKQAKLFNDELLLKGMTFDNRFIMSNLTLSSQSLDNSLKSVALQFMPAEKVAGLELTASQIGLNIANKKLSYTKGLGVMSQIALNAVLGGYYSEQKRGLKLDNDVRESSITEEKRSNQYFWKTQEYQNQFNFDVQKDYNTSYFNKKNGYIEPKDIGLNLGKMLLENSLMNYKLQGIDLDFDVDYKASDSYRLMRWVGNSGREGFGGYSMPSIRFDNSTRNYNNFLY